MKQINKKQFSHSIISPLGFGWSTGYVKSKKVLKESIKEDKI